MNGQEQNEPPHPCAGNNHPVRVQSTRTPLQGRGFSQCLIKDGIRLYCAAMPESILSTKQEIKLQRGRTPGPRSLSTDYKKKTRAFPSPGGVAAAPADDGVV